MSNDVEMSSDDEPMMAKVGSSAANGKMNGNGAHNANASDSDSSDVPLAKSTAKRSSKPPSKSLKRKKRVDDSSSDDDVPLSTKQAKTASSSSARVSNGKRKASLKAPVVDSDDEEEEEAQSSDTDSDVPISKKKKAKPAPASNGKAKQPRAKKPKVESDASDDDDRPLKSKMKKRTSKALKSDVEDEKPSLSTPAKPSRKPAKVKAGSESPSKKAKREEDEAAAEEEAVYKWWEGTVGAEGGDNSAKWNTLEHNGVLFPPLYEPLPKNIKMKYNNVSVDLPSDAEEVAGFYAAMLATDHAQDATFNKNFFTDFKKILKKYPPKNNINIEDFNLCDFRPMHEYMEAEKAKKKLMTTAEKKQLKKDKDDAEAAYAFCNIDGRREKIGNFRVEPPGLFRGRGEHPKKGCLKLRVKPEDIILNIGKEAATPIPNMPGNWKGVQHDNTVTWLANWTENVNGNHKYVFLAAGSAWKGQSDMLKFEKARSLKDHVERIRQDYQNDLKDSVMATRQRATAMYFIDRLALRNGNEKGEDEADTVGCCSLRCEHLTLEEPNFVTFDFLGKDSIRYVNRVSVSPQVFKNIRIFKKGKTDVDPLFDRVTTTIMNKHLSGYMAGLTAKVFRTYNASITFQEQLDENTPKNASVQEKLNAYNHANRMVAVLCNHQRAVPKTHEQSMGKMRDKIRGLKYDRMKLRHALFVSDPSLKKNKKYKDDESDLDEDWIITYEDEKKTKDIEKAEKKFAKDNEKRAAEEKEPLENSVLKEKIKDIEAAHKVLVKERGTGQHASNKSDDKLKDGIDKLDEKITVFKLQSEDREAGKEVALGTSKINYLDPRITAAWCKIHDVPIEKIFNKSLLVKFPWAMEVEDDWKF